MDNYDIIVVDDDLLLARAMAQHLGLATKLSVVAVDSPATALEQVAPGAIKIAVLDQRMPEMDGVTLFKAMRDRDDLIRAIMLTDKAEASEVASAFDEGFGAYVEKPNFATELASRVLEQYVAYETEVERRNSLDPFSIVQRARRGRLLGREEITYQILRYVSAGKLTVFDQTWKTDGVVAAGERKLIRRRLTNVIRYREEEEWNQKLTTGLGVDIKNLSTLSSKLEQELAGRVLRESGQEIQEEVTEEIEVKLPDEPVDPKILHVLSREYQSAPAYRRVQILLSSLCSCCGRSRTVPLEFFQWTGRLATRQVEVWSDETIRTTITSADIEVRKYMAPAGSG